MPRKQNGFGSSKSFSVNGISKDINKGKSIQGSGRYPSDRQFGSTVTRSAVQKWNIDSTWQMWRKGYEYARQNIWVNLNVLFFAFLFSGTTNRTRANFRCKRFPSLKNDTATRYVVKREIAPSVVDPRYATITSIINTPPPQNPQTDDEKQRAKNFKNEEIWLQVTPNPALNVPGDDVDRVGRVGDALKRMTHERITNKRHGVDYSGTKTFEATVKDLRKSNGRPMIYTATSHGKDTVVKVTIPNNADNSNDLLNTPFVQDPDLGLPALVGQVVRVTNQPIARPKGPHVTLSDETFTNKEGQQIDNVVVDMDMNETNQAFWIANVTGQTPFEVFVDVNPLFILTGNNATFQMKQQFRINKSKYQQFFDFYLTSNTVDNETSHMSNIFPPLYIADVSQTADGVVLTTIPFEAQLWLYGDDPAPYLVLSDFSFTSWEVQPETITTANGDTIPNSEAGYTFNDTNVYPWQDETFTVGDGIYMADSYACNCESYSKSTVTSPEALYRRYTGAALTKNRQLKFPLPSALSNKDIENLDNREAGVITNWASRQDRLRFKTCKHCIASTFAEETITTGFIGNVDADQDEITNVNSTGEDKGFQVGQAVLPATDERKGLFFIVAEAGSNIAQAPGVAFERGDRCFCAGLEKGWIRLNSEDTGVPGTGGVSEGRNKSFYVLEPNTFPSGIDAYELEQKIIEQTRKIDFSESGPRAEISPIDFAFATLQLLNLMDTEVGSILGGNVALIPVNSTT